MKVNTLSLLFIISGSVLLAGTAVASRRPEYIETPKATLLLLPAVSIAAGEVEQQAWSSDGMWCAVVVRKENSSSFDSMLNLGSDSSHHLGQPPELFVWDRATGATKQLGPIADADTDMTVDQVVGIHGSPEFLILATAYHHARQPSAETMEKGVLTVNAATGNMQWLTGFGGAWDVSATTSPTKPQAALMVTQGGADRKDFGASMLMIGAQGQVESQTSLPPIYAQWEVRWSQDGMSCLFENYSKKGWMKLQADGSLALSNEKPYDVVQRNPELLLTDRPYLAKIRSARRSLKALWLSSVVTTNHPDAFVSADGKQSSIAPSLDAAFYVEDGIAKIRTWVPLSDDQKKALMDALKADAIKSASQVALGLIMFSNDNDDMLPGASELDGIMPYIKDSSLLDGFNYTPPSNLNSASWTSPSETVIGTVPGPGGSAVAYGDGHVNWRPNP